MLIRIDSSVVDNEDQSTWSTETVEALQMLATARREGKHSLIAERKTLEKISQCTRLSENARQIYKKLSEKFTQFEAYRTAVTRYIELVHSCHEPNLDLITYPGKEVIKVPPRFFNDSALVQKTILLCENDSDAILYKKIAQVYLIWKKISVPIEYDPQGGGGSTISPVYVRIQQEKKRICLCIVDSDRIAPDGCLGGTAKLIQSEHDPKCIITHLLILDLHEIENLIPNSILSELCLKDIKRQNSLDILKVIQKSSVKDVRGFIDIKNGTSLEKIVSNTNPDNIKDFWKPRLPDIPDISNRIDPWCQNNWSCSNNKKDEKCSCNISLGFGDKILNHAIDYLKEKSPHEIAKIVDEDMRREWEKVGEVILNWCIAESPMRAI